MLMDLRMWGSTRGLGISRSVSWPSTIRGNQARVWTALACTFRWVNSAPLEMPVVPPVYINTAVSSMPISTGVGLAGAPARTSWNQ